MRLRENKCVEEMSSVRTAVKSSFFSENNKVLQSVNDQSKLNRESPRKKVRVEIKDTSEDSESEDEYQRKLENGNRKKKIVRIIGAKSKENDSEDEKNNSYLDCRMLRDSNRNKRNVHLENIAKVKEQESDSSDEENNSDPDYKTDDDTNRCNPIMIKIEQDSTMSEYEKMIERNRAERIAFIESLKLEEAKAGLLEVVDKVKKKKVQPVKRYFKSVEPKSPPILRKSRRLANVSIDLSEDALFAKAVKDAKELDKRRGIPLKAKAATREFRALMQNIDVGRYSVEAKKVESIPPELTFKEALQFEELYSSFIKDVNIQEPKAESKFTSYDKSVIKKLIPEESNIAKVTPDRITALAWYPSSENLIIAAGSKYGNLGIWNVDSESSPYVLKTHLEGTTNLQFNPLNPVQLVSSSYDGTVRCGDMVKHIFNEVYNVSDQTCCTWFDFLSESTYLVAHKNGEVALVDTRSGKKHGEKRHTCHDYSIKTVNVHPVNKDFVVTAENKGTIRLWDLRKLQNPVANITHHKRCVQSAYFSPVTGNSILTTSADDTICLFDSTHLTSNIKLKQQMKHNNLTGRWLSVFRATWLPNSDDSFVIGSMQEPRRIQVYDNKMDVVHIIMHDNLTTVSSTNAFHPFRPALAGGNSSGKVFVLT